MTAKNKQQKTFNVFLLLFFYPYKENFLSNLFVKTYKQNVVSFVFTIKSVCDYIKVFPARKILRK